VSVPPDGLTQAEDELEQLAAHVDTVVPGESDYLRAVLALAHRARSLFIGFRHALKSPAPVAGMSLVRPMVEINILLRFLDRNPDLHTELWIAEGVRQIGVFADEYEKDPFLIERWGPPPADTTATRDEARAKVATARKKALAAKVKGVGRDGPVLPSTKAMADGDPAAKEAYTLAYTAR
jgi:hypothetical protein